MPAQVIYPAGGMQGKVKCCNQWELTSASGKEVFLPVNNAAVTDCPIWKRVQFCALNSLDTHIKAIYICS